RRKLLTDQVYKAALMQIERDPSLMEDAALVLAHPGWPAGVLGIVASRLVERTHKPVVLLSIPSGDLARGSARSIEGVDISAALRQQDELLSSFGGHPMAAGMSIEPQRIPEFRRLLSRSVARMLGDAPPRPPLQIDGHIELAELSMQLVADLERLAPFGPGNPPLTLVSHRLRA
ncbi:MAG: DHHA1 domain-containing protein, partial [Anaerolineales bacterium]